MLWCLIFLAGGAGAWCRFSLDSALKKRWTHPVPIGTVTINFLGSFALGLLTGYALNHPEHQILTTVIGVGFLGGFTTFSTAMVEAVNAARSGQALASFWLALGQIIGALILAFAGLTLGTAVF